MNFEFTQPKNKKIETDELIQDLIGVAEKLGKAPTMAEYNNAGKYEVSVFCRRFGSWNTALLKANLSVNNREYTEIELYSNIENVWIYLGKQPTRRDMDKEYSNISSGAYIRHFHTWTNALKSFIIYINDVRPDRTALRKIVHVVVDRPLGSIHPEHTDIVYDVNYGFVPTAIGGDGEAQDAYILGVDEPISEFDGIVVAIIHRLDDNEDKWVVAPQGVSLTDEEIYSKTKFQEKYFQIELIRH